MYEKIEGDYWKEILVGLLQKNMSKVSAQRLLVSDCQKVFDRFNLIFPQLQPEITLTENYATWEMFITPSVKLRLYIQSQVKVTLLQKKDGDLEKIADGKFPYNPFDEIIELVNNRDKYLVEVEKLKRDNLKETKIQKITAEFIKAHLMKKFKGKDVLWNLDYEKNGFSLVIDENGEKKVIQLSTDNYIDEISRLNFE